MCGVCCNGSTRRITRSFTQSDSKTRTKPPTRSPSWTRILTMARTWSYWSKLVTGHQPLFAFPSRLSLASTQPPTNCRGGKPGRSMIAKAICPGRTHEDHCHITTQEVVCNGHQHDIVFSADIIIGAQATRPNGSV